MACFQVRGSTSPIDELKYIISKAGCSGLVVDDTQILDRLVPVLSSSAVHNGAASNGVAGNGAGSNGASCHQVPDSRACMPVASRSSNVPLL